MRASEVNINHFFNTFKKLLRKLKTALLHYITFYSICDDHCLPVSPT